MRSDNTPKYIQNWEQLLRINPGTARLIEKIFRLPSTVPLLPTLNPDRVKAEDIRRLQKFEKQGIYYRKEDLEKIIGVDHKRPSFVNGQAVSYKKLVNTDLTVNLSNEVTNLITEMKLSHFV